MILKLCMKHLGMELYKVCKTQKNHDPGMTLTYLTTRSTEVAHVFEWGKIGKCHLMAENLLGMKIYAYDNILGPGGCLPLPQGYIHVYDQNIRTASLKPLGQSKPNFMCSILRKKE